MGQELPVSKIDRRDFLRLSGGAVAASAFIGTASADPSADWPQPRANAARTASTAASGPKDTVQTRWSVTGDSNGVVVGDCIYIGDSGIIRAIRLADGSERWRVQTAGSRVSLSAGDETIYAAVGGNNWSSLLALSVADGTERWRNEQFQSIFVPTVGDDLYSIVEESDANDEETSSSLVALSAADGTVQWTQPLDMEEPTAPAVANDTIYIAGSEVVAIDTDGEEMWRNPAGGGTPAVANDTVYVTFSPGVRALSASDGFEQWEYVATVDDRPAEYAFPSAPAIVDETIYFGLTDYAREDATAMYALSATTGSEQWTTLFERDIVVGAPAVADGVLYSHVAGFADFPSERGTVEAGRAIALDADDGTLRWEVDDAEDTLFSDPIVTDGLVLVEKHSILADESVILALEEADS
ncbi:outer membrane protein assembly factor BamB family protein [Halalkalicoccus jeotgali]|uniref:outer membrane protein assembly factor BamB family protein n=1 Tax=Halalkalicoccus jeotgali TaxID=413810 RepID=UPI000AF9B531|nr:PQQ-binding-like beta-propeller repeat protein [Halalkalicoccus jeotgali]